MGKENAWKGARVMNKRDEELTNKVMSFEDNEVRLKRKIRAPLEEIPMGEKAGEKQKIEGEVLALSKIIVTQLGSATAAGQPRQEQ